MVTNGNNGNMIDFSTHKNGNLGKACLKEDPFALYNEVFTSEQGWNVTPFFIAVLVYLGVNGCILVMLDLIARLSSLLRPTWREQIISSVVVLLIGVPLMLVVLGQVFFMHRSPDSNDFE